MSKFLFTYTDEEVEDVGRSKVLAEEPRASQNWAQRHSGDVAPNGEPWGLGGALRGKRGPGRKRPMNDEYEPPERWRPR